MFFESLTECYLVFTYVCVTADDVTRDFIDGSTLVCFRYFVFRVYYHLVEGVRRLVVQTYVMCLIYPNCADNPATCGSFSIGLRWWLFVLGDRNLRQHT